MTTIEEGACLIGYVTVTDPMKWVTYCSLVAGTLTAWNATLVVRGTRPVVLAGDSSATEIVMIAFPDVASIEGWYASPSYQALIPLRDEAAAVTIVGYRAGTAADDPRDASA